MNEPMVELQGHDWHRPGFQSLRISAVLSDQTNLYVSLTPKKKKINYGDPKGVQGNMDIGAFLGLLPIFIINFITFFELTVTFNLEII